MGEQKRQETGTYDDLGRVDGSTIPAKIGVFTVVKLDIDRTELQSLFTTTVDSWYYHPWT